MKLFLKKLHLWLSIPFGIVIAIVCATGAILAFENEMTELSHPSRYFVEKSGGRALPPSELVHKARQQLPDSIKITGIKLTSDPERTYQLSYEGSRTTFSIDPYTGEIKGHNARSPFFSTVMRLHRWLLHRYPRDGSPFWGRIIVGTSTLVFIGIILSGLWIWYPRSRKALKNRLSIRVRKGWFRFFYSLHISGGAYVSVLLLGMAFTGVIWSFPWCKKAFYTLCGAEASPPSRQAPGKEAEKKEKQETDYTVWDGLLAELRDRYADFNYISLTDGSASVSTANYGNSGQKDLFRFDKRNGQITEVRRYQDQPKSNKLRDWIYSIHIGNWGGPFTRILSALAALLASVSVISGYYFWLRKKFAKKRRKT